MKEKKQRENMRNADLKVRIFEFMVWFLKGYATLDLWQIFYGLLINYVNAWFSKLHFAWENGNWFKSYFPLLISTIIIIKFFLPVKDYFEEQAKKSTRNYRSEFA